jgi:transposase
LPAHARTHATRIRNARRQGRAPLDARSCAPLSRRCQSRARAVRRRSADSLTWVLARKAEHQRADLAAARRKWLGEQRFEHATEQITFDADVHAVDLVDRRIEAPERAIRETAEQQPWRELVAWLRCLRGIDTLTALALVAEVGDFTRFRTAEEFMAFVGLVPSEHSSGEHRRRGCGVR